MPSPQIKIIYTIAKWLRFQDFYVARNVRNAPRSKNRGKIPGIFTRGVKVEEHTTDGFISATIIPPKLKSDKHIIYYHGGHYVNEADPLMFIFAVNLAKKSGLKVTMPDYPMAPESTYKETHKWAAKNLEQLINHYGGETYLMGDSAGGGLVLAMAQNLKKLGKPKRYEKLLLLCPWLDLMMEDLTEEDDKRDFVLQRKTMTLAKEWYSGGDDCRQFLLSPLYGDLTDIGDITVWVGTEELNAKGGAELEKRAKEQNVSLTIYREEGQHHDYFLMPVPEQAKVIEQIIGKVF